MGFMDSLNVSASGMSTQRFRTNVISENIANAQTTRTPEGGPYRRKDVIVAAVPNDRSFEEELRSIEKSDSSAVQAKVVGVTTDDKPPILKYDPKHPDANEDGYVAMPNINTMEEMVNLMNASRSYEANVEVFNAIKNMANTALQIGKG